jgi:hypothetical protein
LSEFGRRCFLASPHRLHFRVASCITTVFFQLPNSHLNVILMTLLSASPDVLRNRGYDGRTFNLRHENLTPIIRILTVEIDEPQPKQIEGEGGS